MVPNKYGLTHAGIYVDNETVVHAVPDKVVISHVLDFCRCDSVFVLRMP